MVVDAVYRVVVSGAREWNLTATMRRRFARLPPGTIIVHGNERGADKTADFVAKSMGFQTEHIEADWDHLGNFAGPIRNRQMLDTKPDLVLAFHPDLYGRSKGTRDCVQEARRRGIPVEIFTE